MGIGSGSVVSGGRVGSGTAGAVVSVVSSGAVVSSVSAARTGISSAAISRHKKSVFPLFFFTLPPPPVGKIERRSTGHFQTDPVFPFTPTL